MTQPVIFQRVEGAAILAVAILVYFLVSGGPWLLFLVLLLAPDIFMLGYLAGPRAGALTYNIGHTLVTPLALFIAVYWLGTTFHEFDPIYLWYIVLIWFAHIGLDRALGYGLKETTGFQHTHLGDIGKR